MEDKSTCQILTDKKLENCLSSPVKSNTFIKSYYDGLVFIFPKVILITRIDGTIPTAKVIQVKNFVDAAMYRGHSIIDTISEFFSTFRIKWWLN